MSNTPFTVYDSTNVWLQGGAPEISGVPGDRPDVVGNPNSGPHTADQWFNKSAFKKLDPGLQAEQFGDAGRNNGVRPPVQQREFLAIQQIAVLERRDIRIRVAMFNHL